MIDPDEPCGVCGVARDQHGDMNHEFNIDGDLIPLKKGPEPKAQPPKERTTGSPLLDATISDAAKELGDNPLTRMVLRLIEVLIHKNLIQPMELLYIFSGMGNPNATDPRGTKTSSTGTDEESSPA